MRKTENTGQQQHPGRFRPGQSGNPAGRPRGSRNRATLAAEAILDHEAETLTRKCVDLALQGDTVALKLCLERLAPPRRDRPAPFELPPIKRASDARDAFAAVIAAAASGELSTNEALAMARLIEKFVEVDQSSEDARREKKSGLLFDF